MHLLLKLFLWNGLRVCTSLTSSLIVLHEFRWSQILPKFFQPRSFHSSWRRRRWWSHPGRVAASGEIRRQFADSGCKTPSFKRCLTKASACRCTSPGPRTWWPGSSSTRAGLGTRLIAEGFGFTRLRRNRPERKSSKSSDNIVSITEVHFFIFFSS